MVILFFSDSSNRVVPPNVFYVLMWIYFLITLFLLFSSGVQIVGKYYL